MRNPHTRTRFRKGDQKGDSKETKGGPENELTSSPWVWLIDLGILGSHYVRLAENEEVRVGGEARGVDHLTGSSRVAIIKDHSMRLFTLVR